MRQIFSVCFLILIILQIAVFAQSGSVSGEQARPETLRQFIDKLNKNVDNNTLREQIIKFVNEMKPPPVIPEQDDRLLVVGTT